VDILEEMEEILKENHREINAKVIGVNLGKDNEDFYIIHRGVKYWLRELGEFSERDNNTKWLVELDLDDKTFMPLEKSRKVKYVRRLGDYKLKLTKEIKMDILKEMDEILGEGNEIPDFIQNGLDKIRSEIDNIVIFATEGKDEEDPNIGDIYSHLDSLETALIKLSGK